MKWLRHNLLNVLDVVKFAGLLALVLMLINLTAKVAQQTAATQQIVKSQNQILEAIREATNDSRITSEQKTNLIICMLQVPVDQRTTDTLSNCRKQSEPATTGSRTTVTGSTSTKGATTPAASSSPSVSPSPSPTPKPGVVQALLRLVGIGN